jgi:hypothetical protein
MCWLDASFVMANKQEGSMLKPVDCSSKRTPEIDNNRNIPSYSGKSAEFLLNCFNPF